MQGVFDINFARDVVLGRKLGSGAFGSVFQGTWRSEQVAVKMVPIVSTDDGHGDRELESLKSEIEVLSRLQHPNIICFYGACLVPPHICILEELATCSLASRLHGDMGTDMPLKYAEVTLIIHCTKHYEFAASTSGQSFAVKYWKGALRKYVHRFSGWQQISAQQWPTYIQMLSTGTLSHRMSSWIVNVMPKYAILVLQSSKKAHL